jgi:aconitate hydratase
MKILPLEFPEGTTRKTLNISGSEKIDIVGLTEHMKPQMMVKVIIHRDDGTQTEINLLSRIDTLIELDYYKNGGILQQVIRGMLNLKFDKGHNYLKH